MGYMYQNDVYLAAQHKATMDATVRFREHRARAVRFGIA